MEIFPEKMNGAGAWNRLAGLGQPAPTLNGSDDSSGSMDTGGNSLSNPDAGTSLTSGGGNAPIYSGGNSGGSATDTGDVLGNLSQTVSDDWPWILGAVAVAGGLGLAVYLAHRKKTSR